LQAFVDIYIKDFKLISTAKNMNLSSDIANLQAFDSNSLLYYAMVVSNKIHYLFDSYKH